MRHAHRRNLVLLTRIVLAILFVCIALYLLLGARKLREKLGLDRVTAPDRSLLTNPFVVEELDGYLVYPRMFSPGSSALNETLILVSHTTSAHLERLPALALRWEAPISLAVFTPTVQIFSSVVKKISRLRACDKVVWRFVTFHIVTLSDVRPSGKSLVYSEVDAEECSKFVKSFSHPEVEKPDNYALSVPYPNNLLRNVGRKYVKADYVLVLDIDMTPNINLHRDFLAFLHNQLSLESGSKLAYVLPAFELATSSSDREVEYPSTKSELLVLLVRMRVRPFYFEVCWPCQQPTNYGRWTTLESPDTAPLQVAYNVEWIDPWEPFYITKNSAPMYDARFQQYGFNRISQVKTVFSKQKVKNKLVCGFVLGL
ncbi:hypothetical protein RvY_14219 [Ramazzottius varieornatus]|uniref:Beta-1,4-glucuronyltransferase 1 n=1 Tax=Ramazzottius varieornatus TaxID=947166 RepID=A0A1D1VXU5_RAMVA|nr:hypothetical protein RvY_14219 [Ramazzottius varieornatus]